MRCYLQSEIFSECLGEPDDVEYVTVKLQWIALEYAAIRHAAFCAGTGKAHFPMRPCAAVW